MAGLALGGVLLLAGCGGDPGTSAYRAGIRALKRGEYARSARLLEESLNPGASNVPAAAACNALGVARYRMGERERALEAFEAASRLDATVSDPVYNMGVLLAESGQEARAAARFSQAAALGPGDTRALEYLGCMYYAHRQWNDARQAWSEAYRRAPYQPRILTGLALLELQGTNMVRALSFLQEALDHNARYAPAVYNLAMINYRWLKNDSQAESLFRDYLRLAPGGEGADQAALALHALGRPAQPAPAPAPTGGEPRASPAAAPETEPASPSFEEILDVARRFERAGRLDTAFKHYLRAAREADRAGRPTRREQAVREAVRLCERSPDRHLAAGQYLAAAGQTEPALVHFKQAVELSNDWYEAHAALADAAARQGELDAAAVSLREADRLRADSPEALWALAQLYDVRLNLGRQAGELYARFIERFGDDPRATTARSRLAALKPGAAPVSEPARSRWWRWFR